MTWQAWCLIMWSQGHGRHAVEAWRAWLADHEYCLTTEGQPHDPPRPEHACGEPEALAWRTPAECWQVMRQHDPEHRIWAVAMLKAYYLCGGTAKDIQNR